MNKLLLALIVFFVLLAIVGINMNSAEMCVASVLFFASIGIVYSVSYFRLRTELPKGDGVGGDGEATGDIERRLDVLEQRMTDVQDVMIALSEKFDRWEEEKIKS